MDCPGMESETTPEVVNTPVDSTKESFINLAEKMKLNPDTIAMIKKDLNFDEKSPKPEIEVEKKEVPTPNGDVEVTKVEGKNITPDQLLTGLKKILGYSKE